MRETKEILRDYTILYAEDDISLRGTIVELLDRYFGRVYEASDGREALGIYQEYRVDVVMCDIDMPIVDGLEVASIIRKSNRDIPIVILTAYSDRDKLLKAIELQLIKYLLKPIEPDSFRETLKEIAKELHYIKGDLLNLSSGYYYQSREKELYFQDSIIRLSPKEKRLLELLILQRDRGVTYEDIMLYVWDDSRDRDISIESVKSLVTRLRKRLPLDTITNIYGRGYIIKIV